MVIANFSPAPLRDSLPIQYPNITTAELINVFYLAFSNLSSALEIFYLCEICSRGRCHVKADIEQALLLWDT